MTTPAQTELPAGCPACGAPRDHPDSLLCGDCLTAARDEAAWLDGVVT